MNFNVYKAGSTGSTANSATTAMVIASTAFVGIGSTSPNYPLVVGTSSSNGNGAYLSAAGVWTNASDRRIKENVHSIPYGLDEIMKLHPVAYDMIGTRDKQIGFIAQDVMKIVPEVVDVPKNPEVEHYGLSYGNLVAVVVRGLQQLKDMFDADHAEIAALKATNDNQAKSIEDLRVLIRKEQQDFEDYKKAHP
jgi:hypothetical protein